MKDNSIRNILFYGLIGFSTGVLAIVVLLNPSLLNPSILFQSRYFVLCLLFLILILAISLAVLISRYRKLKKRIAEQDKEIYELHLQIGELQKKSKD